MASAAWFQIPPTLATVAHAVLALAVIGLLGLSVSPFLMRAPRAGPKTRYFGCFLYSAGLWILVRGLIGGFGALVGVILFLWEKAKDIDAITNSIEELQKQVSIGWLIVFIGAIGLLGLLGEHLRKISEKHHEIARWGFRKLFESRVASAFPDDLDNAASAVLAYRAVWEGCFNVPGRKNVDGWKFGDLCERVRLICFVPTIVAMQPVTAAAGATIRVTGTGFTKARALYFGFVKATVNHVDSDSQMSATIPPGRGTVTLKVVSGAGVASTTAAATFTYSAPAAPPSVPPASPPPTP